MGDLWDAVTWQNLRDKAGPVMGYPDGPYMWPAEAWQEYQSRPALEISVTADELYPVFDAETGNAGNEAVATAVANRLQNRQWSTVYSNQANVPGLQQALRGKGVALRDASFWPAPGVYLHVADPSGNIAAGRWHPPVDPVAVQDVWEAGWDHSTTHGSYPVIGAPVPAPTTEEIDVLLIRDPAGHVCTFTGAHKAPVTEPASLAAFQAAGVKLVEISQAEFNAIPWAR